MLLLKRLSIVLILIVVVVLGALLSVQNATPVPLDLLAVQLDPRPVALWVLLAFALGGFAGLAASMAAIVKLQSGQRSLRRQLGKQTRQAAANTGQKT